MERAVIMHDPQTVSAERIQEIIEDRGFDAEVLATDIPSPLLPRRSAADAHKRGDNTMTTTVGIEGMTCGACTSAVEGGFKDVPGVKSFNISLLSERAVIEHDPSLLSAEKIAEMIEDRGFDATIISSERAAASTQAYGGSREEKEETIATTTVAIEGMTCGACTSAVEGGFKDLEGALRFNISLLAERAVITHDIEKLPASKIAEIIEDRGFGAEVLSTTYQSNDQTVGTSTAQFKLYGNLDAAEATLLENSLAELPGINSVTISLSTSRLTVTYRPNLVGLRAIVGVVESQGLNALIADNEDNNAQLESLAKTREIGEWRRAFTVSLAFAVPVFLISMVLPMIHFLDFGSLRLLPGLYLGDLICLCLTVPVQFGIGKRFYISAYRSIKHKSPTMDVLVILGTSCAFFFSIFAMVMSIVCQPHTRPTTLFDTSTMLITFVSLGRFLENRAKGQTSKALSRLMSLAPSMATIYVDPIAAEKAGEDWDLADKTEKAKAENTNNDGHATEERVIPTELIQLGDIVILRPGDKIPADGVLVRGETYVDESMVTGEAMPVQKTKGSVMIGGTVNGHGRVDFRVTRAGRDTQLSQIVKLVQDAQTARAPIQQLADHVAGWFVPIILGLGFTTFIGWMALSHLLVNPPSIFLKEESGGKVMVCIKLCISVVVFACPCALGLATPTAVMVGTGVGAENGILVKGGAALETATKITLVVLDKTGTITYGKMSVAKAGLTPLWNDGQTKTRLWWALVGLAEMGSEHPVGKAILLAAKEQLNLGSEGILEGSVGNFHAAVGRGIAADVEPALTHDRTRFRVLAGNARFLLENGVSIPQDAIKASELVGANKDAKAPHAGTTNIFVAIDGDYAGYLCLADTIKEGAEATIAVLHRMGIKTAMVTGDQRSTALSVAAAVGIPADQVHAGVSPDQKQDIVREMQAAGEIVAMVGDGINDSPALATAATGIAMASGTDVAMEAADIVLMRSAELMDVPAALALARSIFSRIKLNLAWACLYNIVGLPFAMGLFLPFGLHLHPMAAGAAMACSSVSVVVSSLLLKMWKRPRYMDDALKGRVRGSRLGWLWGVLGRRQEGYIPLQTLDRAEEA